MRFASLLLLLTGCWGTAISANDYDQTCSTASDCVVVADGDACGACRCPTAAVNTKAELQFRRDKNAIACVSLGPQPLCGVCADAMVVCTSGTCGIAR